MDVEGSQGKEDRSAQRESGINKADVRLRFFDVVVDIDSGSQGEGDLACLSTNLSRWCSCLIDRMIE
jgi:hypothetical protein